jgi:hypothetical protein
MEEMLIEKVGQRTFLYDTKSPDYRDQHTRANAWEGIGKELKIKRKFYVSSRDVRIVWPRLKRFHYDSSWVTHLFCNWSHYGTESLLATVSGAITKVCESLHLSSIRRSLYMMDNIGFVLPEVQT